MPRTYSVLLADPNPLLREKMAGVLTRSDTIWCVIQVDGNTGYGIHQAIPALARMEAIGALGVIEQPVARLSDMADLAAQAAAIRSSDGIRSGTLLGAA